MALPNRGGRSRSTIVLLVLTAATLLTLDGRDFGPLQTMQEGLREVISPVRDAADGVVSPVGNVWNGITDYDAIKAENDELRAEVERLRGDAIRDEAALEELEALRAQVGLDAGDFLVVVAEVRGKPIGNFEQFSIEIDRGDDDGLVEDMAVITDAGLVGLVDEVSGGRATVTLVSDPNFTIGVAVAGGTVLARGTGDESMLRIDSVLSAVSDVEVGDIVTTSSSLVPPGLPVGRVAAIDRDDDGNIEGIDIEVAAELGHLEFVTVVLVSPTVIAEQRDDVFGNTVTTTTALPGAPTTTLATNDGSGDQ